MILVHTLITARQAAPEALAEQAQQRLSRRTTGCGETGGQPRPALTPATTMIFSRCARRSITFRGRCRPERYPCGKTATTTTKDIRVATYYAWRDCTGW
ncbi:hypothetical protein ACVXG7_04500 [Enterobacter hormaechei]